MPSPTSLKVKGKQKAIGDDVLTFGDLENGTDSGSSSASSSDSGSDSGSDSDSDSGSSSPGSDPGAKYEAGAEGDPPLSRDDLLVYLEDMRRRFSKKSTTDSFADQEEVLIVTPKNK